MKVILLQDVKGQGKKGQRVEVSDGYARNFLIPRNLAVQETADNLNVIKQQEKARQAKIEKEKKEALEIAEKLKSCVVRVPARSGGGGKLFGSITSKEISECISEQYGINIEKNKIVQTEPIKAYGSYEIKCKLGYEVTGTINVIVTEVK